MMTGDWSRLRELEGYLPVFVSAASLVTESKHGKFGIYNTIA